MRTFIIVINLILPIVAVALIWHGLWPLAIGVLFIAHAFLLIGTLVPNCRWLGPLVTSFDTSNREIWLTIDDGPDPVDTPIILNLLDQHNARATFFVIGEKAAAHPELISEIERRGHNIGNHTQTHPASSFWMAGMRRTRREIIQCQDTLNGRPLMFRAPAGMRNIFVHSVLRKLKMCLVGWTARGFDGTETDPKKVIERIRTKLRPGAIILVHEGRAKTKDVIPSLLELLKAEDYHCVIPRI